MSCVAWEALALLWNPVGPVLNDGMQTTSVTSCIFGSGGGPPMYHGEHIAIAGELIDFCQHNMTQGWDDGDCFEGYCGKKTGYNLDGISYGQNTNLISRKTWRVEPILAYCLASVADRGPTSNRYWEGYCIWWDAAHFHNCWEWWNKLFLERIWL